MQIPPWRTSIVLVALAGAASAQTFVVDANHIPQGPLSNASVTENVELVDVDLDGDPDVVWADGGAAGDQQNRLWLNAGFAQGGTIGVFVDRTAAQLPAVLDSSRDVDFVDVEGDGDFDLFIANSSGVSNQTCRWWINTGGAQGGSSGYFVDQTAARYLEIAVNDGAAKCSSIAPSVALASGGFIDWCCDGAVADLDADGDLDLVQSSYGQLTSGRVPTRMFQNDGSGHFREFNPSCFQLSGTDIAPDSPGLWCQGVHVPATQDSSGAQCDISTDLMAIELGDTDGDLDPELLLGNKFGPPRVFENRLAAGQLAWRDVTYAIAAQNWAPGPGNYDQELGDMDQDGDLDIYGLNWINLDDAQIFNQGNGTFAPGTTIPMSTARQIEVDLLDHDQDGDLDAFVASETIEELVCVNPGAAGNWLMAIDPAVVPVITASAQGCDARDVDLDGDTDVFLATLAFEPDVLYLNTSDVPDTSAPSVRRLEQAPDRDWGPAPSVVRVQVYDNAPWYMTAMAKVELEYVAGSGPPGVAPMRWSGGQVFRGEIPGTLLGPVAYRAVAHDEMSNAAATGWLGYVSNPCSGQVQSYCTAKTNSLGCVPWIQAIGTPSASLAQPFRIRAQEVLSNKLGVLFYGFVSDATPFLGGWRCVQPPLRRTTLVSSEGNPPPIDCSGMLSFDFNHHIRHGGNPALVSGATVHAQYWYRDPAASFGSGLSDALNFVICP